MNIANAVKYLKEVKRVFDLYKVEFWLDSGSLLGAVRDQCIIPWDNDIDLGVWSKDLDSLSKALKELKKQGFASSVQPGYVQLIKQDVPVNVSVYLEIGDSAVKEWGPVQYRVNLFGAKVYRRLVYGLLYPHLCRLSLRHAHNLKICVTLLNARLTCFAKGWLKRNLLIRYDTFLSHSYWFVPATWFKSLTGIAFYGDVYNIPQDASGYLQYRYGKNWREPVNAWSTRQSDGALVLYKQNFYTENMEYFLHADDRCNGTTT